MKISKTVFLIFWSVCSIAQQKPVYTDLLDHHNNFYQQKISNTLSRVDDFAQYDSLLRRHYERARDKYAVGSPHYRSVAQDSGLTLLGRWAWGPSQAVASQGNYAYIGNGSLVQVLDVSEPAAPHIVGELLVNYVTDIQVRDTLAFVCDGASLIVLDISNPAAPTLISGVDLPGYADRVGLGDSMAYVLGTGGRLQAVDIADPFHLRLRGYTFAGGSVNFGDEAFAVSGRYVYVGGMVNCPCAIDIVNATNPDSLYVAGGFYPTSYHEISAATRDTLLLVGMHSIGGNALEIYSIANPVSPRFLGGLSGFNDVAAIAIHDTVAYIAATGGVRSISIANPSRPRIIRSVSSGIGKLAYTQGRLHISSYNSVYVLAATPPDSMRVASVFPVGGDALKIALRDTLAFIASDAAGLWIVNIADPKHPRSVSNVRPGGYAYDVVVGGNYAYFVNWPAYSFKDPSRGLWIVDISDPLHPQIASHDTGIVRYSNWSVPNSITLFGDLVLITQVPTQGDDRVVEFINVSNPAQPTQTGLVRGTFGPYNLSVKDSILFVASSDSGLIIFDIHMPVDPVRIGAVPQVVAYSVVVRDTFAFVESGYFYIINIVRPDSPFVVGSTPTHYSASYSDLAISGNFAYWVDSQAGIVDISNPHQPKQIWSADYGGRDGVAARTDTIYYAQSSSGVWIWKNNVVTTIEELNDRAIPSDYTLCQNYPNPFNDRTIIEFEAPRKGHVCIEVFNVLGQRVRTIIDDVVGQGHHKIPFTVAGLSTGVYFYRLQTSSGVIARPMMYIK